MTKTRFKASMAHMMSVDVAWGEMDALGHINNVVYFRYLESARIAYFYALDMPVRGDLHGPGPVLAHVACQFRYPVFYPDQLLIGSSVRNIGKTSIAMEHKVYSTSQERITAEGTSLMVLVDYSNMEKMRVPEWMREKIAEFEKGKP